MTGKLKTLIDTAQEMSPAERVELIRTLAQALPALEARISASEPGQLLTFLDDSQRVSPVEDVADLAVDFWPEDESADDVNGYIYLQRHEDRMTD